MRYQRPDGQVVWASVKVAAVRQGDKVTGFIGTVDDITVRDVPAVVAERGALGTNLLGMSFLSRLKSFQMQGSELILVQ